MYITITWAPYICSSINGMSVKIGNMVSMASLKNKTDWIKNNYKSMQILIKL